MKSKNLPKDTNVAVYMRVGREEQLSPEQKLFNAVTEFIESDKMTFKFTEQEVKVLRDALLYKPKGAELFEHLSNRLRDYRGKERNNVDRSTEKS